MRRNTNGDAALDQLLNAVRKARSTYGSKDLRPIAIHAQLARHDQVDQMGPLGIVPSFFTAHTFLNRARAPLRRANALTW